MWPYRDGQSGTDGLFLFTKLQMASNFLCNKNVVCDLDCSNNLETIKAFMASQVN